MFVVLVAQLCPTLCNPMDCSPPDFSVHGILQGRKLEWVAISFSGDLPDPGIEPRSPALQADTLTSEPPGKPLTIWRLSTKELMLSNCGTGEDSRVPWTARRSNQSILKEINPEYSLEEWMLKLQHFGHLTYIADSLEKTLMLEKIEGKRRGQQRRRWLVSPTR